MKTRCICKDWDTFFS